MPEKSCIFACSSFAYTIGLWAAKNPNRVEALFLASPAGFDIGPNPDIYKRRIQTNRKDPPPKHLVDSMAKTFNELKWIEMEARLGEEKEKRKCLNQV